MLNHEIDNNYKTNNPDIVNSSKYVCMFAIYRTLVPKLKLFLRNTYLNGKIKKTNYPPLSPISLFPINSILKD